MIPARGEAVNKLGGIIDPIWKAAKNQRLAKIYEIIASIVMNRGYPHAQLWDA